MNDLFNNDEVLMDTLKEIGDIGVDDDGNIVLTNTKQIKYICRGTTDEDDLAAGTVLIKNMGENNDDRPSTQWQVQDRFADYITGCFEELRNLGNFADTFMQDWLNQR